MKENGSIARSRPQEIKHRKCRSPIKVTDSTITKHPRNGVKSDIHRKSADTNILGEIKTTIRLTVQQEMQRILGEFSKQSEGSSSKDAPKKRLEPADIIELDKSNDAHEPSLLELEREESESETGSGEDEIDVVQVNEVDSESHGGEEEEEKQLKNKDAEDVAVKKKKKTRGPTNCNSIHARKLEDREVIKVNKEGQPIGDSKTCDGFSRFLGTLARNSKWVPFTCSNWRKVGAKEKEALWDYVNKKYIVPAEAKNWVLKTIANAWRVYKSRLKKQIFLKYKTHEERLKHRPQNISAKHFNALLEQWSHPNDQKRSLKNKQIRQMLRNVHRAGPKSLARMQEESMPLEQTFSFETQKSNIGKEQSEEFIGRNSSEQMHFSDGGITENHMSRPAVDNDAMVVGQSKANEARKKLIENIQSKLERQRVDFAQRFELAIAILQQCNPSMMIPANIFDFLVPNSSCGIVPGSARQEPHLDGALHRGVQRDRSNNES